MPRHTLKKRSRKAGLPPGSLIHIGEKKTADMKIAVLDYDEHGSNEAVPVQLEQCIAYRATSTVTWVDIEGGHDIQGLEKLGLCFGLHPLVMEDILNTDQRPKLEDYGDYLYIVLRMLSNGHENGEIGSEQVSLILGKNFVLSIQEGAEGDVFDPVRTIEKLRGLAADAARKAPVPPTLGRTRRITALRAAGAFPRQTRSGFWAMPCKSLSPKI